MWPDPGSIFNVIAAVPAETTPVGIEPTRIQQTLMGIDQGCSAIALGLVIVIGVWWSARPDRASFGQESWRPNRVYEDSVAVAAAIYLSAAALLSMLTSALAAESESPVATMFVGNGAQIVGLGACCVIAARRFDGGIPRFLFGPFKSRPHATTLMTIIVILLALGICPLIRDATVALIHNVAPSHDFKPHTTLKALHEPGQPIAVVAALWVGAVVIAPLAEESFFRGLLQTFLSNIIPNRWPAIALTSVAFGLIHFPQPHAIGALIVLGLLIGYAYERTGSLLVAAFIHAVFNLKTLVWVTLGSSTV